MTSRHFSRVVFFGIALAGTLAAVGAPLPTRLRNPDGPLGMKFVRLPKGTFYLGGGGGRAGTKTEVPADFEIAVHLVTQAQWQAVMGNNPSWFSLATDGADRVKDLSDADLKRLPVETVSWDDVRAFLWKLNERERGTGWTYRLPTDVEWEYACRAGGTTEEECSYHFYFGEPTNDMTSAQANFYEGGKTFSCPTPVGSYRPNKIGLYDMHGNVWQWCEDRAPTDGYRVIRGGTFGGIAEYCRAGYRNGHDQASRSPFHGFRLVRVPSGGK